jgi:prephenate dehydrogenase
MVAASRGAGLVAEPRPSSVSVVVVATPPVVTSSVVVDALSQYPNAAVTDVASVKAPILETVADTAENPDRYLGSHPMAGSQYSGPVTASADIFTDRTWVITPTPATPDWVLQRINNLAATCGARVLQLAATDHDRAVAEISHLPQLMASLTAARLAQVPTQDLNLAGQGVRDVTRIAASDPGLWQQIVAANRSEIRRQLTAVRDDLENLLADLDSDTGVANLIERGNAGVAALPGKHGRRAAELVSVVVEIPDTPGALARLFAAIDAADVNVEDISIEHSAFKEVGFLAIQVDPSKADSLRNSLETDGWRVRSS